VSGCATGGLSRRAQLHGVSNDISESNLEECKVASEPGSHYTADTHVVSVGTEWRNKEYNWKNDTGRHYSVVARATTLLGMLKS
jgi:hypothetical protein